MVPCQKVAKRLFPQSSREEVASMTLPLPRVATFWLYYTTQKSLRQAGFFVRLSFTFFAEYSIILLCCKGSKVIPQPRKEGR